MTRNRIFALAAAGVVLAGGVTVASLAAWTDVEWVAGGAAGDPGVTASTFEVEQNVGTADVWSHHEEAADANLVDFSAAAAQLTPGDTVYGFVRLRTTVDSLGGQLELASETIVNGGLSAALTYGAWLLDDHTACDAAGVVGAAALVATGSPLTADGPAPFTLDAATDSAPGAERTVCFAISFDESFAGAEELQGDSVTPLWRFDAISVS